MLSQDQIHAIEKLGELFSELESKLDPQNQEKLVWTGIKQAQCIFLLKLGLNIQGLDSAQAKKGQALFNSIKRGQKNRKDP